MAKILAINGTKRFKCENKVCIQSFFYYFLTFFSDRFDMFSSKLTKFTKGTFSEGPQLRKILPEGKFQKSDKKLMLQGAFWWPKNLATVIHVICPKITKFFFRTPYSHRVYFWVTKKQEKGEKKRGKCGRKAEIFQAHGWWIGEEPWSVFNFAF